MRDPRSVMETRDIAGGHQFLTLRRLATPTELIRECTAECWPMINEKETTMASNEEIIRNLYAVAEKEPKRFRSLFTKNGYWWDVPAGAKYRGDEVARAADIYSAAFRTCTANSPSCTLTVTSSSLSCR